MKLNSFGQFFLLFGVLFGTQIELGDSGNVLFIVACSSKSHKNVVDPIAKGLAERNHTVTIVSSFKPSIPTKNIREIVTTGYDKAKKAFGRPLESRSLGPLGIMLKGDFNGFFEGCDDVFRNSEFMGLLNEKFDLIFIDGAMNDCFYGLIYKLGSPFVIVTPFVVPGYISQFVGHRFPPSFVPFPMLDYSDSMSFFQRVVNFVTPLIFDLMFLVLAPKFEAVYREHLGQDLPGIKEINSNVSMIFSNSHLSLTLPRPLLPDIIEVGGMHCNEPKPLPADLEKFVSGAKDGVILFSLGSIVQANEMSEHTRKVFLNVFARLKQRVIWKWETDKMDDLPPNVKIMNWVPQQDILGHPNTRLFMTHGGLLSTQESTFYGVPILAIPVFGDQDLNAQQAETRGYGLRIEILDVTEEILEEKINRLLTEKRFLERVKQLSALFRDQPESPLSRAVFWSEYIMRHKGAHHLRSAARDLNFIQYYSIDSIAFLILILVVWISITICLTKMCCRKMCGKKTSNDKTKKRQ